MEGFRINYFPDEDPVMGLGIPAGILPETHVEVTRGDIGTIGD